MYMKVTSADFRAKMGFYMKAVKEGAEIVLTDRKRAVAKIVPIENERKPAIVWLQTGKAPSNIDVNAIRYHGPSTLSLLERERER